MILRHVSAALLVLDGFTGRPLGQRVVCALDGVPLARPVWKPDGWLVVTDLAPGEHQLVLRCPGFQEQTLSLSGEGLTQESVILIPGAGYAFPRGTAFLSIAFSGPPDAQARMFAGTPGPRPLKLAREAKAGDSALKMFLRGPAPSPGWFILKGKETEAAFLRDVSFDGNAETASPLTLAHSRGETLIPALPFPAAPGQTLRAPFRNAGEAALLCGGTFQTVKLRTDAETRLEWNLEA